MKVSPAVFRRFAGLTTVLSALAALATAQAATTITFTRAEVSSMALLWETDCAAVSPLANAQYPGYSGLWQFIFPRGPVLDDGDIHVDMALDATATGSSGNNTGASPIICEVINARAGELDHLLALRGRQAVFRGIFRFYTEHKAERHFELHPVTALQVWNGSTFADDTDYHGHVAAVSDGASHTSATLTNLLDGSQKVTAGVTLDNDHIIFTFPSPGVNYVQYDGTALSGVQRDAVSAYFLFRPNLVPEVPVRCRMVDNTTAAGVASALSPGQNVTVNALTRTDMAAIGAQIAGMSAGQSNTFPRPVELILLGASNVSAGLHPAFFAGEAQIPNSNFYYLTFSNGNISGYYSYQYFPYLYHNDLGFEYFIDANDGQSGAYLYDFASSTFFYTSPGFPFPYLYDFKLNAFLYYFPDPNRPGHYTNGPRYFYNFSTGQIITK